MTDGAGVNVVYDSVGQATFEKSLDSLAPLGSLVIFGQSSGPVPPFDTAVLNAKGSLSLMRPSLTHNVSNHADVARRAGDLFNWIMAGRLNVTIGNSFPLSEAARAHRALESRQSCRQNSADSLNKMACTAGAQKSDAFRLLRKR